MAVPRLLALSINPVRQAANSLVSQAYQKAVSQISPLRSFAHTAPTSASITALQAQLKPKATKWDHGLPLPSHHLHIELVAATAKAKGLPSRSHTIGEFPKGKGHQASPWAKESLVGYVPLDDDLGVYQSVATATARQGFEKFYEGVTGRKIPAAEGVILESGSSSAIFRTLMYLKAVKVNIAFLESSYPTYKALYQRVHNGDSPVEISRPLSREKGMTIDASNMPKEINAVLMNTIGNPGGEHLKNEDIAKVVEAILKNHDEALIVLDEAYQGISGDVKDKFKNIGDFLEKYPQLKGKVKFIELLSTSKIGRGPGDRMAGIVVDPAISGSFSSYYRPTQLGVPRFAQFFWSNVAKRSTEEIQTSSKQSYEAFHANNQLLTDELSTACPNAFVPPHEGGMFNVVDIKGEYEARLGAKLGQLNLREKMDTSFSVPEFVKTTITDHIVNGHVVYFTSVDKKSCLRVNLGDTPENIKQFAKDLDTALTLFVESKVKQIQERENQETA